MDFLNASHIYVKQEEDESIKSIKSHPEDFCEDLNPVLTTKFVTGNWIKQETSTDLKTNLSD